MRKYALLFALAALSTGCKNGGNTSVQCGMKSDADSVRTILEEHSDCPGCQLKAVEGAIAGCKNDRALQLIGFYSAHRANRDDRATYFYELMESSSEVPSEVHSDAAFIYRALGDHKKSLSSFTLALKNKDDLIFKYERAQKLISLKQYDQAIVELKAVIAAATPVREASKVQIIGDDAIFDDASIALAKVYEAIGNKELARSTYSDILSVFPEDKDAKDALEALSIP